MRELSYVTLWAKSTPYHTLWCHLLDVAAVVESLLKGPRSFLVDENPALLPLLVLLGGGHDIGKASPDFQGMNGELAAAVAENGFPLGERGPGRVHHGIISAIILKKHLHQILKWPVNQAAQAAKASGIHHGQLVIEPTFGYGWGMGLLPHDLGLWTKAQDELLEMLQGATGHVLAEWSDEAQIPDAAQWVGLAGLISFADWIGSNQKYFPFQDVAGTSPGEYYKEALKTATKALGELGFRSLPPHNTRPTFQGLFPAISKPRPLQEEIISLLTKKPETHLLIVEAPMGEGKTEAAFFAAAHWEKACSGGCYVALPTQATSNAMYGRMIEWMSRLHPGEAHGAMLLHGGLVKPEDFERVRVSAVNEDEREVSSARVYSWFLQAKRGLLAPYAVGTIDQALLGVLPNKHHFIRLHGLQGKTVIFDEVHAYDVYTGSLLEGLLGWLRVLGARVVILSATLPPSKRRGLLEAFGGEENSAPDTYPRITAVSEKGIVEQVFFPASAAKKVSLAWMESNPHEVLSHLSSMMKDGGCAAVILNTVGEAQEWFHHANDMFNADWGPVLLLHSRFTAGEREERESKVMKFFGKGADHRPHRALLISTQVVEQSLDVDFDLMVTALAPVDLVLQRSGRLHRHDRQRPAGLEHPGLIILAPNVCGEPPDYGNSARVYEMAILMRTHAVLQTREQIQLPEDFDPLINAVYTDGDFAELPDGWRISHDEAAKRMEKGAQSHRQTAEGASIPKALQAASYWRSSKAALNDPEDPGAHRDTRALTRLGGISLRVICLHEINGRLYFDREGAHEISETYPPDSEIISLLYNSTATFSERFPGDPLISAIQKEGALPPVWKETDRFQWMYLLRFSEDIAQPDGQVVKWSSKTGFERIKPLKGGTDA
ncbi:MAG: CRISPR-associated helicase Cas3' [Candidatus Sumerlaeia bacterium]|nr:CRISPR-associated helicase Cas3' [Candidatus Sumerlaeia bacterium]